MKAEKLPRWIIRSMQLADLTFAAACTAAEGWASETLATFEGFYQHDPNGCFLAELAGRPVGICVATSYGHSGFIGELIVHPEARGCGIGAALLNHAVEYLRRQGAETVYLDGVVKAVPLYERNGFRKLCRSLRFFGTLKGPCVLAGQHAKASSGLLSASNPLHRLPPRGESHSDIRPMRSDDLPAVFMLDQQAFGADRSFLFARRLQLFPELCQVMVEDGKLTGFILGRRGEGWAAAGPWVIAQEARAPLRLLKSLACQVGDVTLSVGVLETNHRAVEQIRSLGFVVREDSPWRMALGPSSDLGASPLCFAVGTAATG